MGDALLLEARTRGQVWAERTLCQLTGDVHWPENPMILSRIAELDVCDLAFTAGERRRLVQTWIEAAGSRWREARI